MGLVFIDGFDDRATSETKWEQRSVSAPNFTALTTRTGPGALNVSGSLSWIQKCVPSQTFYCAGVALYQTTSPSANWFNVLSFQSGDTSSDKQVWVEYSPNEKKFRVVTNSQSHTNESGRIDISTGWFYIELDANIHGSTGDYEFWVNGVSTLTGSGLNTDSTGDGDITWVRLASGGGNMVFDDFYLLDSGNKYPNAGSVPANTAALGPCNVYTRNMIGDSTHLSQFTAQGGGTNHDELDEIEDGATGIPAGNTHHDGDDDYVESSTTGHQDLYDSGTIPSLTTIHGVQLSTYAQQTDAGTLDLRHIIGTGSNSTVYDSETDHTVGSAAYFCYTNIWDGDPVDDDAWDTTDVNAREYGFEVA